MEKIKIPNPEPEILAANASLSLIGCVSLNKLLNVCYPLNLSCSTSKLVQLLICEESEQLRTETEV